MLNLKEILALNPTAVENRYREQVKNEIIIAAKAGSNCYSNSTLPLEMMQKFKAELTDDGFRAIIRINNEDSNRVHYTLEVYWP